MELLHNIQQFFHINFVRVGFLIVLFIYLLSRFPKISGKIALQIMRYAILINLALSWLYYFMLYLNVKQVFNFERATGPYATWYWVMLTGNLILPFLLLLPFLSKRYWFVALISLLTSIGFWMERYIIIVTSFHRDFLPDGHSSDFEWIPLISLSVIIQSLIIALILIGIEQLFLKYRNTRQSLINNS